MVPSTRTFLLATLAVILAGGCATASSTLRATDPYACDRAQGSQFAASVCATRGRPDTLGNDHVSPNLWVSLATRNAAMNDSRDWAIAVTRDGRSVLSRRLPQAPQGSWAGNRSRVDLFVSLPGKRWVPGRYQVTLVFALNPSDRVTTQFEVKPGNGEKASATGEALPGSCCQRPPVASVASNTSGIRYVPPSHAFRVVPAFPNPYVH